MILNLLYFFLLKTYVPHYLPQSIFIARYSISSFCQAVKFNSKEVKVREYSVIDLWLA